MRFDIHYTRDEARALLPSIRKWLKRLVTLRDQIEKQERRLTTLRVPGTDIGGPAVNTWIKALVEIKEVLLEFHRREIQVKDLDRGLIDFPAIVDDREVFLCWELEEEDIDFWHDLVAGYGGREPLSD